MMGQWKVSGLKEGFLKTMDASVYPREAIKRERLKINVGLHRISITSLL